MLWVIISLPDKNFSAHKCTKSFFNRSLFPAVVPSNDSNKIVMAICTNWEWKSRLCSSSTHSFASLRSPTEMNPLRNDSDFLWRTAWDSRAGAGPLLYEAIWVLKWLWKYIFGALTVFGTLAIALACKWETIPCEPWSITEEQTVDNIYCSKISCTLLSQYFFDHLFTCKQALFYMQAWGPLTWKQD